MRSRNRSFVVAIFVLATGILLATSVWSNAGAAELVWGADGPESELIGSTRPAIAVGGIQFDEVAGSHGRAATFASASDERISAVFVRGEAVPATEAEVWIRIQVDARLIPKPGTRRWLIALVPLVGETGFPTEETGMGLALAVSEHGRLQLLVHRFEEGRLTADYRSPSGLTEIADPDEIPVELDLRAEIPSRWSWLKLGWKVSRNAARVFIAVDDRSADAELKWTPTTHRNLIVGAPPLIKFNAKDVPFTGHLDELVIRDEASRVSVPPRMNTPNDHAPSQAVVTGFTRGVEYDLPKAEERARESLGLHFNRVIELGNRAGWAPIVTHPSGMHFLSRKSMIPYSDRHYLGMTNASTPIVALRLLTAYRATGDTRLLDTAKRVADLLLELQTPQGGWPSLALIARDGRIRTRNPDRLTFKDRTQSIPILFLAAMHEETGATTYLESARKGISLLLRAQNENGSWPNHVLIKGFVRESVSGSKGSGELNDWATSDAASLSLWLYRRTGNLDALARYLRAADWAANAFIDSKAKGWARQYDANGRPIKARHHEPPAVALEDMGAVPCMLADAYRVTGHERYKQVLETWVEWMEATRVGEGWHPNYDPTTGRPIRMVNSVIMPDDEGGRADFGMTNSIRYVRDSLAGQAIKNPKPTEERVAALARAAMRSLEDFDYAAGSWITENGPQGRAFTPATGRVATLMAFLQSKDRLRAQEAELVTADDVLDPFNLLMPRSERLERIPRSVLAEASTRSLSSPTASHHEYSPGRHFEPD